jgi:nitrate/nitrite transport system permease protein
MKRLFSQSWFLSLLILLIFIGVWHLATAGNGSSSGSTAPVDAEYAKLVGQTQAAQQQSALPTPKAVFIRSGELLRHAFDRNGTNDQGIGWHLLYSLGRVLGGYLIAVLIGVPCGFAIGLFPRLYGALNPFIQVLKPVSPMAWMPLALYILKDSGASAIFIIFICSVWPLLINTAFGVAGVRQDWINVARVLDLNVWDRVVHIIFPAAVPMILTGMRISIGTAWFVIVAAEMVAGQSGIGYFIWNEWNNLQIASMITAIVSIGLIGLCLDWLLVFCTNHLAFKE